MAFVADVEMVANFWLRSGDAHTANNFEAFLLQTLSHLQNKTIGLLRADTGFYSKKIFELLETQHQPYILRNCLPDVCDYSANYSKSKSMDENR